MIVKARSQQRGITLFGLVFFGGILAFIGLVAAQTIPAVTEYFSIKKVTNTVKTKGDTVKSIQDAFDSVKHLDDITSISGKDLDVRKIGNKIVIYYAYNKEIPIIEPVYLLIKFRGNTD
jgi:hypothetical protein